MLLRLMGVRAHPRRQRATVSLLDPRKRPRVEPQKTTPVGPKARLDGVGTPDRANMEAHLQALGSPGTFQVHPASLRSGRHEQARVVKDCFQRMIPDCWPPYYGIHS